MRSEVASRRFVWKVGSGSSVIALNITVGANSFMMNFQYFFRTLSVRKIVSPRWELLDRNNRKGDELITRDELYAEIASVRVMIARVHDELIPLWSLVHELERQIQEWKEHLL